MNRRRASREVNLAAVAKRLGVSISTVSRALRNEPGINAETRERVFEMAKAIGYVTSTDLGTNRRARPLNILALGQPTDAGVDQRYLAGMSAAAVALNISILSHHLAAEALETILDPACQPINMRNGLVDGIVLIHCWPDGVARRLSEQYPVVSLIHAYPDASLDLVGTDDRQGSLVLARHLKAGGHEKIGFFGLSPQVSWARSRFAAYVEALVTLGLPLSMGNAVTVTTEEALSAAPFPAGDWARQVDEGARRGITAWISANAVAGQALCGHLFARGVRVPDDVAVTGFHRRGFPLPGMARLTSVELADEDLGAAALRRLGLRIKNRDESRRTILLPMVFNQGETTRPTPAS